MIKSKCVKANRCNVSPRRVKRLGGGFAVNHGQRQSNTSKILCGKKTEGVNGKVKTEAAW